MHHFPFFFVHWFFQWLDSYHTRNNCFNTRWYGLFDTAYYYTCDFATKRIGITSNKGWLRTVHTSLSNNISDHFSPFLQELGEVYFQQLLQKRIKVKSMAYLLSMPCQSTHVIGSSHSVKVFVLYNLHRWEWWYRNLIKWTTLLVKSKERPSQLEISISHALLATTNGTERQL